MNEHFGDAFLFPNLDNTPRIDWTENEFVGNPNSLKEFLSFDRLKCHCGKTDSFEILYTAAYETTAMCTSCHRYYVVHTG